MDSPPKREKLQAAKKARKRGAYPKSGAPPYDENVLFHERNRGARKVYSRMADTKAVHLALVSRKNSRGCTVVAGHADPSTGDAISDPD